MSSFHNWSVAVSLVCCTACMPASAADAGPGKAATCMACHGQNGISNNDEWPNLAGQKAGYLVKAMKAFRDGTRSDVMMSPMAKPLTDDEIKGLADYFSKLGDKK